MRRRYKQNRQNRKFKIRPVLYLVLLALALLGAERIFYLRQLASLKEDVVIIEGEAPYASNYLEGGGYISRDFGFMGDRALQLATSKEVPGGYFFEYKFSVSAEGEYNVVLCGTPPGPKEQGSPWHSPYAVSIDNSQAVVLYEEDIASSWPVFERFNYLSGGYYFTRILAVRLSEGEHTIRITVDSRRRKDEKYTIYIDAILVVPKGYVPFISTKKLPKRLFEAL